jgi:hypothetical protein
MILLPVVARRAALVAVKQAQPFCQMSVKALAAQSNRLVSTQVLGFSVLKVDDDDVDDGEGNRLAQQLEDMLETTLALENSMQDLKDTYAQKRHAFTKRQPGKMNVLFDQAAAQKEQMSKQIASLKAKMVEARTNFAVDAPDGTSDAQAKANHDAVNDIINYAANHEDYDKVIEQHQQARFERARARKTFAVDAPDGSPDANLDAVNDIINYAADHEDYDKVVKQHQQARFERARARKTFAVDAPDGSPDDLLRRSKEEVDEIINYAAAHEDIDMINKQHALVEAEHEMDLKILAVDAPDGTPDDAIKRNLKEVEQIIEYAATHEDVDMINKEHELVEAEHEMDQKILAVDAPDGTPDDAVKRNLKEVEQIIEYAATHENVDMINKQHALVEAERAADRKIFAVDAPDGSADYQLKEGFKEVDQIIDFAATHEDVKNINYRHGMEQAVREERARDPEHDW